MTSGADPAPSKIATVTPPVSIAPRIVILLFSDFNMLISCQDGNYLNFVLSVWKSENLHQIL